MLRFLNRRRERYASYARFSSAFSSFKTSKSCFFCTGEYGASVCSFWNMFSQQRGVNRFHKYRMQKGRIQVYALAAVLYANLAISWRLDLLQDLKYIFTWNILLVACTMKKIVNFLGCRKRARLPCMIAVIESRESIVMSLFSKWSLAQKSIGLSTSFGIFDNIWLFIWKAGRYCRCIVFERRFGSSNRGTRSLWNRGLRFLWCSRNGNRKPNFS